MKTILATYDPTLKMLSVNGVTVQFIIVDGSPLFSAIMAAKEVQASTAVDTASLVDLKKAGFATDDIIQLRREGLV